MVSALVSFNANSATRLVQFAAVSCWLVAAIGPCGRFVQIHAFLDRLEDDGNLVRFLVKPVLHSFPGMIELDPMKNGGRRDCASPRPLMILPEASGLSRS